MQARRFRVEGRVQGVFFRASTQERAQAVGLTGWVRNLSDGAVEVYACGESAALQALQEWLWQGPDRAQVTAVDVADAPEEELASFEIR